MNTKQNNNAGSNYSSGGDMTVNQHAPNFLKNKSILAEVVNILSKSHISKNTSIKSKRPPHEIEEKIKHNNVIKSRYIIDCYKYNVPDLAKAYDVLEKEKTGKKDKILAIIKMEYNKELATIVDIVEEDKIKKIREQSDNILENIVKELNKKIIESSNLDAYNEDVNIAIMLIVADAFIECIVLEKPKVIT